MTLSSDLRRIADDLHQLGQWDSVDKVRRAAEALEWRQLDSDPPPIGEYVLIWVPSRPWISKSPTVFAKVARRVEHPSTPSGFTWEDFGPGNYSDYEIAAWMPITPPSPERARE